MVIHPHKRRHPPPEITENPLRTGRERGPTRSGKPARCGNTGTGSTGSQPYQEYNPKNENGSTTGGVLPPPIDRDQWSQLKPELSTLDMKDLLYRRMRQLRGLSYVLAQGATGAHGAQFDGEEFSDFAWLLWEHASETLNVFRRLDSMK